MRHVLAAAATPHAGATHSGQVSPHLNTFVCLFVWLYIVDHILILWPYPSLQGQLNIANEVSKIDLSSQSVTEAGRGAETAFPRAPCDDPKTFKFTLRDTALHHLLVHIDLLSPDV